MKLEFSLTSEELREAAEASAAAHKRGWLWVAVVASVPFTLYSILGPLPKPVQRDSTSNVELLRPFVPYFPMILAVLFTLKSVKQKQKDSKPEMLIVQGRKSLWLSAGALRCYLLILAVVSALVFHRRTASTDATNSAAPIANVWGEWVFWLTIIVAVLIVRWRFQKKSRKRLMLKFSHGRWNIHMKASPHRMT